MAHSEHSEEIGKLLDDVLGQPNEALDAVEERDLDDNDIQNFAERYQRRRDLAQLGQFPEGYVFHHVLDDGHGNFQETEVTLLTPPDMVADQAANGIWTRRARDLYLDGPAPYDENWYQDYLVRHNLPLWFMRAEHLAIINNATEATALNLNNEPTNATIPPLNYLDTQYPELPHYIRLSEQQREAGNTELIVPERRIPNLARRFPAVNVNAAHGDRRVFVTPSDHVLVRYRAPEDLAADEDRPDDKLRWAFEPLGRPLRSSYSFVPRASERTEEERQADEDAAHSDFVFPNLEMQPQGPGEWTWLRRAVDEPLARAVRIRSLQTLEDVVRAQTGRHLRALRPLERPVAVWTPNSSTFNPNHQPAGPGQWTFHTTGEGSDEELTVINFGGQALYGFGAVPRPSAGQMWNLRQQRRRDGEFDPTRDINLVWIAGGTTVTDGQTFSNEPRIDEVQEEIDAAVRDPNTRLHHDPSNRGEFDQTGDPDTRIYQTRYIDRKKWTIDRDRARVGNEQQHLLTIINKSGKMWPTAQAKGVAKNGKTVPFDWNNKDHISDLNRSRDQLYLRNGWRAKREEDRPEYTEEQKKWMYYRLKGKKPKDYKALREAFNEEFDETRDLSGTTAQADRMVKKYNDEEGAWESKPRRGENKTEQKRKREADEAEAKLEDDEGEEKEEAEEEEEEEAEGDDGSKRKASKEKKNGKTKHSEKNDETELTRRQKTKRTRADEDGGDADNASLPKKKTKKIKKSAPRDDDEYEDVDDGKGDSMEE